MKTRRRRTPDYWGLTGVIVLYEPSELFLRLVFRDGLGIDFALFDEPCAELLLLVVQAK